MSVLGLEEAFALALERMEVQLVLAVPDLRVVASPAGTASILKRKV
jgi:hypothetical protein